MLGLVQAFLQNKNKNISIRRTKILIDVSFRKFFNLKLLLAGTATGWFAFYYHFPNVFLKILSSFLLAVLDPVIFLITDKFYFTLSVNNYEYLQYFHSQVYGKTVTLNYILQNRSNEPQELVIIIFSCVKLFLSLFLCCVKRIYLCVVLHVFHFNF